MTAEKLESLLAEKTSDEPVAQLSDFMLDLIEHHTEKKLVTRRLMGPAREV